jgi:hypothetical protein
MLQPTAGRAWVEGLDAATQMAAIRRGLGVCPQFDILWPHLTVREHLSTYWALKGGARGARGAAVEGAAAEASGGGGGRGAGDGGRGALGPPFASCSTQTAEAVLGLRRPRFHLSAPNRRRLHACHSSTPQVGLTDKLDALAGELSGGQRRKLSVAIAFLARPKVGASWPAGWPPGTLGCRRGRAGTSTRTARTRAAGARPVPHSLPPHPPPPHPPTQVVILDEPTSGMDPISRRATWDIIRARWGGWGLRLGSRVTACWLRTRRRHATPLPPPS